MSNAANHQSCDYDVVIAGGGMVGASLALQLSCNSEDKLRVLVVESFPIKAAQQDEDKPAAPVYSPSFDARSTALSYSSQLILSGLKLWPVVAQHAADISTIHVSEQGSFGSTTMRNSEVGWPALGYVVENHWLGNVLLASLEQKRNVEFLAPAVMLDIHPKTERVELDIEVQGETRQVSTQLVVVADGANSGLRDKLGIQTVVSDYKQTALIANVSFRMPHEGCAYERFTDQGPMALLPLCESDDRSPRAALVWSLPDEQAGFLLSCDEQQFLEQLQERFGNRQGEFTRVGDRFTYPLKLVESQEQVRTGVVVMGNAAHSIHPVAGQGFNLALRDCARLADILVQAFELGQTLGDLSLLQQYRDQQHFDQQKTIGFSDRLPALFSQEQLPISLLRSFGLGILDVATAPKARFIHHAAGVHDGAALG